MKKYSDNAKLAIKVLGVFIICLCISNIVLLMLGKQYYTVK